MQRFFSTFIISLLIFSHIFAIPDSDPCQGASYCEVTLQSRSLNSIPGAQVLPVSPFAASFGKERHHSPPPSPTSWRPTASRTSTKLNRILAKHTFYNVLLLPHVFVSGAEIQKVKTKNRFYFVQFNLEKSSPQFRFFVLLSAPFPVVIF